MCVGVYYLCDGHDVVWWYLVALWGICMAHETAASTMTADAGALGERVRSLLHTCVCVWVCGCVWVYVHVYVSIMCMYACTYVLCE